MTDTNDDIDTCPICDDPIKPGDVCATDIEMGACHAACLEGSPVVDLETGEPLAGKADTFIYGEDGNRTLPAKLDPMKVAREAVATSYVGSDLEALRNWVCKGIQDKSTAVSYAILGARAMLSAVLSARPDVAGVVERLRARTVDALPANWQKGLKCPDCDASADRPKCFFEKGAGCPRHDPHEYDPSPFVRKPDALSTEAADALTTLAAECAALREERDAWRNRESETQEALQKIGEEFGVFGGEPRVDGIRRILTKMRDGLDAIADAYTAHGYSDAMDAVQHLKDIAKEARK
jgi:hypothetical protein